MSPGDGILVTGATGNVGSEVCRHLASSGCPIYGAVTSSEVDGAGTPGSRVVARLHGALPRVFDFTDDTTWDPALEGVSRVFLMRPPHISRIRRDMYPFMAYMKERGIERVVFLSVQGVENNRIVPHYKVEQAILELGIAYTFIRPSFFMQNLTTTHLPEIRDEARIFVPAGDGSTNFIDVRDIGEASYTYREVTFAVPPLASARKRYSSDVFRCSAVMENRSGLKRSPPSQRSMCVPLFVLLTSAPFSCQPTRLRRAAPRLS